MNSNLTENERGLVKIFHQDFPGKDYHLFCACANTLDDFAKPKLDEYYDNIDELKDNIPCETMLLRVVEDRLVGFKSTLSIMYQEEQDVVKMYMVNSASKTSCVVGQIMFNGEGLALGLGGILMKNRFMRWDDAKRVHPERAKDVEDMAFAGLTYYFQLTQWLASREYSLLRTKERKGQMFKGAQTPSDVTYIYKDKRASEMALKGNEVDWSHCWVVLGHYRRIKGTGKDRRGIRNQPGRTWVREHEKQTHLQRVDKVRALK